MVHTHAPLPRGFFGRGMTEQKWEVLSAGLGTNEQNARDETQKLLLYNGSDPADSQDVLAIIVIEEFCFSADALGHRVGSKRQAAA